MLCNVLKVLLYFLYLCFSFPTAAGGDAITFDAIDGEAKITGVSVDTSKGFADVISTNEF